MLLGWTPQKWNEGIYKVIRKREPKWLRSNAVAGAVAVVAGAVVACVFIN